MQNDWEGKFYKELTEIESIKKKVKELRSDYDKLASLLLEGQRTTASLLILNAANIYRLIIKPIDSDLLIQLSSDAGRASGKVSTSQDPITVVRKFQRNFTDLLAKRGYKTTDI